MLEALFPVLVGLVLVAPAVLIAAMLRSWHPGWWRITLVRSLLWSLPVLGVVCLAVGQWAPRLGYDPTQTPLTTLIVLSLATQAALLIALPISAAILRRAPRPPRPLSAKNAGIEASGIAAARADEGAEAEAIVAAVADAVDPGPEAPTPLPEPPEPGRRRFLKTAAAAVPLLAAGGTVAAIAGTINGARVPLIRLGYPDLPRYLDGLRILQLSDLHLGLFTTLPQLATTLDRARELEPHLIVVTGDIADDLGLLPAAMVMINELEPPLGVFSCLGNHEYGNGVDLARDLLAATPGTLLKNFGLPLTYGGGDLFIAGIDDPKGTPPGQDPGEYLRESVDRALERVRPWMFTILLSHRPDIFDHAALKGVELTLAGHFHGGQVGFAGRSLLAVAPGTPYPWGRYRIGNRRLYTSSGAGQWIPFRLGCPAEAPVFELYKERPEEA